MIRPTRVTINAKPEPWTPELYELFDAKVGPLMSEGETVSDANYFTPRPYVHEYDRGSKEAGFVYTVQPGDRVAFIQWVPKEKS